MSLLKLMWTCDVSMKILLTWAIGCLGGRLCETMVDAMPESIEEKIVNA